jgi:formate dehydrogenase major subunit
MTGNCAALKALADEPGFVQIHPDNARQLGIQDQALVWVESRRGKVITRANFNERVNRGAVYMTYQWWVGACNELTQENMDPVTNTPETKYCAVTLKSIDDQNWAESHAEQIYQDLKARLRSVVENAKPAAVAM